jgi:hypothetical protein
MRTSPEAISLTREHVGVASSIISAGLARGSACIANRTYPRRCPKSVPVTRVPREDQPVRCLLVPPASAAANADRNRDIAVVPLVLFFLWGCLGASLVQVVVVFSSQGSVELEMWKGKMSSSRSPLEKSSKEPVLLPSIHLKWRREKEKEASWGLLAMMVLIVAVCTDERKRA